MENKEHRHSGCGSCENHEEPKLGRVKDGFGETTFRISGADCSDEVNAIKKALSAIGVESVSVNLVASTATVQYDSKIDAKDVKAAIESTGVKVVDSADESFYSANQKRILLIVVSGLFLVLGMALDWSKFFDGPILLLVFGLATILSGVLVFPKAWRALLSFTLDMNVLMSIAVLGAFAIKEYSEGATVVFLFSLAELLESFSVSRARQAIKAVLKLTPQVAQIERDGEVVSVPVSEVKVDQIIYVRPGDSFPLDGVVTEGTSTVNQAPLTGESVPVEKKIGDSVFAGTINENGALTMRVTKAFKDTKISRVLQLIEEAQEQKAPSERFVDRFAKIYTPAVFLVALAVALAPPLLLGQNFDQWFYRALVLLVIACPCALVLATPISIVSGLASLARRGVLVKGGKFLEALGKIKAIALDKTGTITEGKYKVQNFRGMSSQNEAEVLRIAMALERSSTHPLAKAILEYGKDVKDIPHVAEFKNIPGRGAEGNVDSCLYFVGNHRMAHELGVCSPDIEAYLQKLEEQTLSVIIVGHKPHRSHKGEVLGIFGLGDSIKPNVPAAIRELHQAGVEKVIVLSGDNQKTVAAICKLTGIDEGKGELLPEGKVEEIKQLSLRYKNIAMVGDGINDAPALANATVGISMGAAGTDAAIETSDVSLMQDDLAQLPKAIRQGRRALNVIRFNIAFAIAIKGVFLGLAIFGFSNLWLAVAADMGASILVSLNALRLLRSSSI
jgi:Cd2+/Zn2+-exporting ATPase